MDLSVHHMGIVVSDLERSKAFYSVLGFELESEKADENKVLTFMRRGDFRLELFCYHMTPERLSGGKLLGFRHLAFATDDVDADLEYLKTAALVGADTEVMVTPSGWRLLFFDDPDGVEIELMERGTGG